MVVVMTLALTELLQEAEITTSSPQLETTVSVPESFKGLRRRGSSLLLKMAGKASESEGVYLTHNDCVPQQAAVIVTEQSRDYDLCGKPVLLK